ncbi:hypothetical protein [Streptococcus acidominimus]|uniref:Uncharacterized protein n=1 Tax=Streptococcus acidominimus TaxID=1326 RepID=A0A4Y9FUF6_STRAI|nr:hypothetical protein [Streptococcus acidominimus]MBF0817869.1 hypothetical protein [Streptococcus acidominimus]MBF0838385.1 hypothetical protein [Streptococcus acidominimus]MBF0846252.1 hypothetical protein [Streptococcus danieliae]TFU31858.1 hypothetical protein E4U01_00105 [Streptococcus acidominimus]
MSTELILKRTVERVVRRMIATGKTHYEKEVIRSIGITGAKFTRFLVIESNGTNFHAKFIIKNYYREGNLDNSKFWASMNIIRHGEDLYIEDFERNLDCPPIRDHWEHIFEEF